MAIKYTSGEEWANALSHALGILIGLIGGWMFLEKASINPDSRAVSCTIIYLAGMLSSYVFSTWYHALPPGNNKKRLRKFDHAAIYWQIASTYTPFTILVLGNSGYWGWGIFIFVWLAAIVGTTLAFRKLKEHSNLETICFILMGCSILVAMKPLIDNLSAIKAMPAFWWLIAGGFSHIVGALFYSFRKLRYMHSIFHLFCLGGSVCHMIAIWQII